MESASQLPYFLVCQFTLFFPTSQICYKCFSYNDIFFLTLGLRSFVVRCITYGNNVWKLRFVFVCHSDVFFLFHHNYVIYFFHVVTIVDDNRIRLYFGTFELRMEMTWKLRFALVRHWNVSFITSKLGYLFVRCNYVFWWR